MPAITRSQSRKQSINEASYFINEALNQTKTIPKDKETQDKATFTAYLKNMLAISAHYSGNVKSYKSMINNPHYRNLKEYNIENYKYFYYENARVITEIYYTIVDWFDLVFVINGKVRSPSIQKMINVTYKKSFELENDIPNGPENPTEEEKHIVNILLNQLKETRALVEPYVTDKNVTQKKTNLRRSSRNIKKVDYTGMDTIEPESEYDGFTNIYADETIYEDPDYQPFEDEEDEEDEDLEAEDLEDEPVVEHVTRNHIRFVY